MKNVILVPNPQKDAGLEVTKRIAEKLLSLGCTLYAERLCELEGQGIILFDTPPDDAELVIVIGGDGSVIDASRLAIALDIPLLGVNLGKVGYLTEAEPDNLALFDKLVAGEYTVESKLLLVTEHKRADGTRSCSERLAVNDVVISQDGYFGIATFKVENSRGEAVNYRGNGIIIATPVGSTAYSLSAGGPIIAHNLDSITVTPVCPHSFFNRSIVYEPSEQIRILNTGEMSLNISIDGRSFEIMEPLDECRIYSSSHKLKMITFKTNNMFSALFDKIRSIENNS
ncbi:MAG: NAD(+)/NADH kinase [Clostridia bacterium]|nr:NAD(+)/NADH kinase [Clostridia bacterium]